MKTVFRLAAIAAVLAASAAAHADVTYTYTGNDFTDGAMSPYSTSDHLSGILKFTAALGSNFSYKQVFPISFSFTGGVAGDAVTSFDGGGGFYAQTDATGVIDGWYIAGSPVSSNNYIQSQFTRYDGAQFDYFKNNGNSASVTGNAGHWDVTVAAVPEPETYALMLAGLGALGMVARRRKSQ